MSGVRDNEPSTGDADFGGDTSARLPPALLPDAAPHATLALGLVPTAAMPATPTPKPSPTPAPTPAAAMKS
jgi:hypothetical protein